MAEVRDGADPTLILLEHPPTYTLGTRGDASHILASGGRLRALGAEVVRTDRGGDVTFHGPGQVVGYPIVDLRRLGIGVSDYVCGLEAMLIDVLRRFGIAGERSERNRGVWVGDAKIAAIGVRVSRGITTHGFALNVNTDLSWFEHIVPCGLPDTRVTSMEAITGIEQEIRSVQEAIVEAFGTQFGLEIAELAEVIA
jgi:lipoate-protein ligase B